MIAPQSPYYEYLEQRTQRISPDGPRWMDQKVTYDNLRINAENICAIGIIQNQSFTRVDLQKNPMFVEKIRRYYNKPNPDSSGSANEYDKFIGQLLNVFASAGLLERKSTAAYTVAYREALEYIATSDENALAFLTDYLVVILKKSGFWPSFETYAKSTHSRSDMDALKTKFHNFQLSNTRLGRRGSQSTSTESGRIFAKVINPLCNNLGIPGVRGGFVSKDIVYFSDLKYNTLNFRDIATGKPKGVSRTEYGRKMVDLVAANKTQPASAVTKNMRLVRERHGLVTEVREPDSLSADANHVHHIFPRSSHPQLADTYENLICLTPGQHLERAHPNGVTTKVDGIYRRSCLFSKLESIRRSVEAGDEFYSYTQFSRVLAEGLNIETPAASYESLRIAISDYGAL